jgi:hypothetical protein
MSYIRSLSNPEALYVWADISGPVTFCVGNACKGEEVTLHSMPLEVFKRLGVLFWDWGWMDEPIEYKGGFIRETSDFRLELGYKDWSTVLWQVTVEHLFGEFKECEKCHRRRNRRSNERRNRNLVTRAAKKRWSGRARRLRTS